MGVCFQNHQKLFYKTKLISIESTCNLNLQKSINQQKISKPYFHHTSTKTMLWTKHIDNNNNTTTEAKWEHLKMFKILKDCHLNDFIICAKRNLKSIFISDLLFFTFFLSLSSSLLYLYYLLNTLLSLYCIVEK